MNRTMEALTAAQHKAAETLYRAAATGWGGQRRAPAPARLAVRRRRRGTGAGLSGDVIDAEVVDEEKK